MTALQIKRVTCKDKDMININGTNLRARLHSIQAVGKALYIFIYFGLTTQRKLYNNHMQKKNINAHRHRHDEASESSRF
jgi:hypothetical protein